MKTVTSQNQGYALKSISISEPIIVELKQLHSGRIFEMGIVELLANGEMTECLTCNDRAKLQAWATVH